MEPQYMMLIEYTPEETRTREFSCKHMIILCLTDHSSAVMGEIECRKKNMHCAVSLGEGGQSAVKGGDHIDKCCGWWVAPYLVVMVE